MLIKIDRKLDALEAALAAEAAEAARAVEAAAARPRLDLGGILRLAVTGSLPPPPARFRR
jgi:hypothetical protein